MSLSKGLYATPGQFYFKGNPCLFPHAPQAPETSSKVSRANALAGRERAKMGIMAVDIGRVGLGIGIRLRLPSLFYNKLSIRYHFHENLPRALSILDFSHRGPAGPSLFRRAGAHPSRLTSIGRIAKRQGALDLYAKIGTLLAIGQQVRHDKLYPPLEWLGRPPFAAAKAHDRAMAVTNSERRLGQLPQRRHDVSLSDPKDPGRDPGERWRPRSSEAPRQARGSQPSHNRRPSRRA